MRTITTEHLNNAIAFLKNRHKVELTRAASPPHDAPRESHEPRVIVDGQPLQREDVVRMAETEGWSDKWKPGPPST